MSAAEVAELASDLGLAGIERQLELPPEVTVDPASLPDDELAAVGAARLPTTLDQALDRFRHCEPLAEAMGSALFDTIIAIREAELTRFEGASEEEIVAATRFRY